MTRETEYRQCDKCGKEHTEVVYTSEGLYGISCTFKKITGRSPVDIHEARSLIHGIIKYAQGSVAVFKQSVRYEQYGDRAQEVQFTINPELTLEDLMNQGE